MSKLSFRPRAELIEILEYVRFVYTAEIDHIEKERNIYNHKEGHFKKIVPPMSKAEGKEPLSISHAKELFSAVTDSYNNKLKNRLLLVKGTKFGTTKGNIKAGADSDFWVVTELQGSVDLGFSFILERMA